MQLDFSRSIFKKQEKIVDRKEKFLFVTTEEDTEGDQNREQHDRGHDHAEDFPLGIGVHI